MSVTAIEAETLRHMKGKEGLIVQGCGGDLDECWAIQARRRSKCTMILIGTSSISSAA